MEANAVPTPVLPFDALEWPSSRKLQPAEKKYLKAVLKDGPADELVAQTREFSVRRSDLQLLAESQKLNDRVIDFYLALAVTRVQALGVKAQFIGSAISALFRKDGNQRKWESELDPYEYDRVVMLLHRPDHWGGLGIDVERHQLVVGDSIGALYEEEMPVLIKWLQHMYQRKYNREDPRDWTVKHAKSPLQKNDLDCGVFALLFCACFLLGAKCRKLYTHADIPAYRRLFALHIISTNIVHSHQPNEPKIRTYDPSSLYLNIQNVLREKHSLSAKQIFEELKDTKRYPRLAGSGPLCYNTVYKKIEAQIAKGVFKATGTQRQRRISLNSYSANIDELIEKKKPLIQRYPTPCNVAGYTYAEKLISLLHRYGKLTKFQMRSLLVTDKYVDAEPIRREHNTHVRSLENAKHPRVTQAQPAPGASFVYELLDGVLPPVDLTPALREAGAVLEVVDGQRRVVVPSQAQTHVLHRATSRLGGRGCTLKQYVGQETWFELKVEPVQHNVDELEPSGPFVFATTIKGRRTFWSAGNHGAASCRVAYANDAGPLCSQLTPIYVKTDHGPAIYWRTLKPVDSGGELFCAYNAGEECFALSHWAFAAYPADWLQPNAFDPVKLHAEALAARQAKELRVANAGPRRKRIHAEKPKTPSALKRTAPADKSRQSAKRQKKSKPAEAHDNDDDDEEKKDGSEAYDDADEAYLRANPPPKPTDPSYAVVKRPIW